MASHGIYMRGDFLTDPFGAIFERQYEAAYRVARKVLPESDAEDIASETMLRVGERLRQGRDTESVEALVPIIAYGLAVDEYRRPERPVGLEQDVREAGVSGGFVTQDQASFPGEFDLTVRELGDDFDAFVLTDLRGLTNREAADVLGVSHMTVQRRRESARLTLREEIA